MKLSQKTLDVLQWVLILGLLVLLTVLGINLKKTKKDLVKSEEYNKQNTYIRIYESQKLEKLKKENKELYDSLAHVQNAESGIIIKFTERYHTDTITVDNFQVIKDTVFKDNQVAGVDSVYKYIQDNDTIKCNIDIKAEKLKWAKADIQIHDKFTIINREKDGQNQTTIGHSGNTTIDGTAMWHRKNNKKWYQRFVVSPTIGVGYGIVNKKADAYVGVGIGYSF